MTVTVLTLNWSAINQTYCSDNTLGEPLGTTWRNFLMHV